MNPAGGGSHGRNPDPSSSASPSSSSSGPTRLGFDPTHQHHHQQQLKRSQQQQQHHQHHQQQQQQQYHQQQQQQQQRKTEGEENIQAYKVGGKHGVIAGGNFASPSNGIPISQLNLSHQHGAQLREENQNKGQVPEQHLQNHVNQAYLQFALQNAQQQKTHGNIMMQHQAKFGTIGPHGRDQDMRANNLKMQDPMSPQVASQSPIPTFQKPAEQFGHEKQLEQGHTSTYKKNELQIPQKAMGQATPTNSLRPMQGCMDNATNNQLVMAQFQAWAMERNIDLSLPGNANLIAQLWPMWQSSRLVALQKAHEAAATINTSGLPTSKQQVMSSPVGSEASAHGSPSSELPGQSGQGKGQQTLPFGSMSSGGATTPVKSNSTQMQQQVAAQSRGSQSERAARPPMAGGNGGQMMHPLQSSGSSSQRIDHSNSKNRHTGSEALQVQYSRPFQQPSRPQTQPAVPSNESTGTQIPSHGGQVQVPQSRVGFTKQQLHVLKAQILAFRRIKRGEGALPQEVLQAIVPPPLNLEQQQVILQPTTANQEKSVGKTVDDHAKYVVTNDNAVSVMPPSKVHGLTKEEPSTGEEKAAMVSNLQRPTSLTEEPVPVPSSRKAEESSISNVKAECDTERDAQVIPIKSDYNADKGKETPIHNAASETSQGKKPVTSSSTPLAKDAQTRRSSAPLFDFPFFTRKPDTLGSSATNNSSNLTLAYDAKDLLYEEGMVVLKKKRTENLKKISGILAINLERKRIRPDLVTRLQIEERKLRLLDFQARLRDEVDEQQQEIMAMSDRPYRKFVRQCERQRIELLRQVQQLQKSTREKQLKSIFQWRKKLLESHWAIRDARTARNRGVAKYHERMLREFSKRKDNDRNKRMEALKNNDVDRYREMLLEQQTNVPGDASQRYVVLSSFLSQTEEYLHKLGGKITATKNHQEVEEAARSAAAAARSQGLSEEEVKAAAACAGEEVTIRNRFSEMNAPRDSASVNKYYNLAHAVNEKVIRQPSMLRAGTLRDYQLVGLQWMLSLYNNKLNGILADEMGLGKTVQVMALIAYLMEFKGNYGPHLIIVPNAVLVNWKSELHNWLPSVSCIFYVGSKDQRSRLFSQVCAMKFNVLVTTYEFVMYDRSKLSRIDWKYIIIDEAQRMKDRESVLARDLDRYRCHRRLLLTGTPLQNDLKELWSLLNLLLPEVFDNKKAFNDWFSKPFQKDGPSHDTEEDDWLETEKKVIIIHRLHQILEPFMLRRRVEDVEGSLPQKVAIVLKCRMSAIQGAIYDWIKSTGTIRVDPEDELRRAQKNPNYQAKMYKNLNNKCMELRKACNHPLLNYPYFNDYSKEFLVRSCGKLWILDRVLLKLHRAGHRVLLFSTMTKLLDILEEYLQWRRLVYRRIDGTTSLEDRESAIVDFNTPGSDCFIFLLSIRAAGRGLNLQSADTVVIYDPDPNPQNEEQAVARAHRIGQKREVKVIYMEAVVDNFSSYQKEDELRTGGTEELDDDDLAGKDRYMGSIESLIRNNIQQYKIDMADEVINAGRFDQRTTHEERRMTLETLLHDEERYQETVHDVPSLQEVNRMIARSEEEIELFDQMDEDFDWTGEMMKHNQVPKWLRAGTRELNAVVAKLSKKPSKNILASSYNLDLNGLSPSKTERRTRPRAPSAIYREVDEDSENSDTSSVERITSSLQEEDGEMGEYEDEDFNVPVDGQPSDKDKQEEGLIFDGGNYGFSHVAEDGRIAHLLEEAASSGSSSGSRRLRQPATPSISLQKFGSLSALDARPKRRSKKLSDELEEGEIAASGDSHMDLQRSGSWNHDLDDGEDEQVLQPKIKRKRSMRIRPRCAIEKLEEKSSSERVPSQGGSSLPMHIGQDYDMKSRTDPELDIFSEPGPERHNLSAPSLRQLRNLPPRRSSQSNVRQPGRLSSLSGSAEDAIDNCREKGNSKASSTGGASFSGTKMSESMHRKCKNVVSKLQRRINKDGYEIVPVLYDLWKRNETSGLPKPVAMISNTSDLRIIDQRVDNLEYNGVTDFIADVQLMLKNAVQYYNFSYEVKYEARKLNDIFFDIMKIAFPDTDFREAKNSLTFPSHGGSSSASPPKKGAAASQSKQQKMVSKPEPSRAPPKPSLCSTSPLQEEGRMTRAYASKFNKESRPATGTSSRDLAPHERSLTHPGDLVICKKKRKDRRAGPVSPSSQGRSSSGPVSPPNAGRVGPPSPPKTGRSSRVSAQQREPVHPTLQSATRPGRPTHPSMQQHDGRSAGPGEPSGAMEGAQWAKPVKRMRTDAGKRRPSHL